MADPVKPVSPAVPEPAYTLSVKPATDSHEPGHPQEQFEVEEQPAITQDEENYPSGAKLVTVITALAFAIALVGLDLTILATAVPSITNHFKTVADIGWYASAYRLTSCAFQFMFGKMYTMFSIKRIFLLSLLIFETGSLLSAVAPTSKAFILGRAVSGLGCAGVIAGVFVIITQTVPLRKRPVIGAVVGGTETLASVSAPILGGVLTDRLSWRACFYLQLPLGAIAVVVIAYFFENPRINPNEGLPFKEKIGKLDLLGTAIFVPSCTSLLLALQWGGAKYGWGNARILVLLVVFVVLLAAFGYLQYRRGDNATLPPRILKNRNIVAGAWFAGCSNASLAVVEYYMAIYLQAVKEYSAQKSGFMMLPQVIGLCVAGLAAGILTSSIGYYTPFMLSTSVLAPIAAVLLTTLNVDADFAKMLLYQALLGFGVGIGIQGPQVAAQTVLKPSEAALGIAVVAFGQGIGPAIMLSAAQTLFADRLIADLGEFSPGLNVTALENMGLADIKSHIGTARLEDVLLGYDKAVTQTFYLPVALTCLTLLGSLPMEWRSVKKKQS